MPAPPETRDAGASVYGRVLRRRLPAIVVLGLIGLMTGFAYASTRPIVYRAAAVLRALPPLQLDASVDLGSRVQAEVAVLRNLELPRDERRSLGVRARPTVAPIGQSDILQLTAEDPHPGRAAAVANAYADLFVEQRSAEQVNRDTVQRFEDALNTLKRETGESPLMTPPSCPPPQGSAPDQMTTFLACTQQAIVAAVNAAIDSPAGTANQLRSRFYASQLGGGVALVIHAAVPTAPVSSGKKRLAAEGLLGGLVIGALIALVWDSLSGRSRTAAAS